jgi:hypothetical protein
MTMGQIGLALFGVMNLLTALAILTGRTWSAGPIRLTTHKSIGWAGVALGILCLAGALFAK